MMKQEVTTVSRLSVALMVLTSIHHAYGAIIYNTPWRLHILMISVPVIIFTGVFYYRVLKKGIRTRSVFFGVYLVLTLVASVALIGLFEGVYNHLLKNALFYTGASHQILIALFPPPTYEMPNDFWFEFTGVLQGIVAIPLTLSFVRLIRGLWVGDRKD
ncbi:hypothetical protein [Chryseolinea soli]|uniref:Uncharacterized protein n=1 Tax=Chryseolinea soli TaxID=2321403 RepID=A0A385SPL0_9BACT|nr:hypothetical protein [Chryseolinea soli]AYB32476.1 hypothetical protein D4L85_18695 [Chryseolinea soli]